MNKSRPKVAVVLGGGGIKPYAILPLITFLQSMNIPVDLLVGCSGGSIMVSMWASGMTPDQVLFEVKRRVKKSTFKPNWNALMAIANFPFGRFDKNSALVRSSPIRRFFEDLWGDLRIEDLKIKTIIQVTDFQTGESIGMETGRLADCVYASSALFPLLPAIKIGDRWLFDGGYTAPVPILQTVKHNVDMIIAVDFLEKVQEDPHGIFDNVMHFSSISTKSIACNQMALALNLLDAEIVFMKVEFEKPISFWEIEKFPEILEAGEKALDRIREDVMQIYQHLSNRE